MDDSYPGSDFPSATVRLTKINKELIEINGQLMEEIKKLNETNESMGRTIQALRDLLKQKK